MAKDLKTHKFMMVVSPAFLVRVDKWRSQQPGLPSRAEAIRSIVDAELDRAGIVADAGARLT